MMRILLKSKIHRAHVTDSNIDYEGSISIDEELMQMADIHKYEKVSVWNVSNGSRFETYALPAEKGSGKIIVNGAAAKLASTGDIVIIASFAIAEDEKPFKPAIIYVDELNKHKQ
ncbi:MAG: aspartate 1-decarboxylase [Candidatus Marsarchaeota archaeon]|nr:aspartate 1-decarboxylase [Candidatus Marsarchaeota archaeon]